MTDFVNSFLMDNPVSRTIMILAIICALGMILGKIKLGGVSLGVSFIFFCGILAGHIGLTIDPQVLSFVQTFGLILFVYALGLQVGPGFFSSFGRNSIKLNIIGLSIIIFGTAIALIFSIFSNPSLPTMIGILCGATTNTPALGAAQQTLMQLQIPQNTVAISCAVAYPIGVLGVIFVIMVLKRIAKKEHIEPIQSNSPQDTCIATFIVNNPDIIGKNIKEIGMMVKTHFVISRIWKKGVVSIPKSETSLDINDRILVTTTMKDTPSLEKLFGKLENKEWSSESIEWNAIDSQLISKVIVVTKPEINGKRLESLKLRNSYGVNICQIYRSGIRLLATPDLILQMGDKLVIVGEKDTIKNVETILGNAEQKLNDPNLAPIFIGIILGVLLGSVPLLVPGIPTPVKLGMAGGPMIMGMIIGTFGPRIHMVIYSTRSANLMLRGIGLSLFLACVGLDSGSEFFNIVVQPEGAYWILLGMIITVIPILTIGLFCYFFLKLDIGTISGTICGSMANPMALNFANDTITGDAPSIAYATVYPLGMFIRVIIVQAVLIIML